MRIRTLVLAGLTALTFAACEKDGDGLAPVTPQRVYNYNFNEGQVAGKSRYTGSKTRTLMATLTIDSLRRDSARVTVSLKNTRSGISYPTGAYDVNDTTGIGYALTPNMRIFSQTITGNGGIASASQTVRYRYDSLINNYNGYLIVRDPDAGAATNDSIAPQSQLIFGTFAR